MTTQRVVVTTNTQSRPHTEHEERYGFCDVAGVDEAGCGPWAGPVVAAAVILRPASLSLSCIHEVNDSKKLSPQKRQRLVKELQEACAPPCDPFAPPLLWSIGQASAQEIDRLNIRNANFLAMQRALDGLSTSPRAILVDGTGGLKATVPVIPIVKGDQTSLSIAVASLFAKVTRDALMDDLHSAFPLYGWADNKGYGTAFHQEALKRHGPTPHHRMSYKPLHAFASLSQSVIQGHQP